jgi:hypothetical protein
MHRLMKICVAVVAVAVCASNAQAGRDLFVIDAVAGPVPLASDGDNSLIDLVSDFIERKDDFGTIISPVYQGSLDYLGIKNAVHFDVSLGGNQVTMTIPSTGISETFTGTSPDDVVDQIEDWVQDEGANEWFDFLRAANALTPLALLSGNPKSSVALMGDSAYRKFGYDDSRSRFGSGEKQLLRIGGMSLRLDVGASSVNTSKFGDDLVTVDPSLTLAGQFGRYIGLSLSLVGQYRDYDGAQLWDGGIELALPVTFLRPDRSRYFWQLTPFIQVAAGGSIDLVAGGLFMGGGLVNSFSYHMDRWEFLMANQISYYGGIPIDDVGGYDFETDLSQLYFKNGLEATYAIGAGFYVDGGVHFSNFALDDAAVPWFVTPTVGVGWQLGRWMDLRIAYEADLDDKDYRSHGGQLKLDFLF